MPPRQDSQVFAQILATQSALDSAVIQRIVEFREILLDENERQNLTRIVEPLDFFEGHVIDCLELIRFGRVEFPAMDLGSGGGVPGLLCAVLEQGSRWTLVESEGRKAEFLSRAVRELGVSDRVSVYTGRAEEFLLKNEVRTVVARAVGKVEKLFGWIGKCSTWNKMVLLKGPGWDEEWREFGQSKFRNHLSLAHRDHYEVKGLETKSRTIVTLQRKP